MPLETQFSVSPGTVVQSPVRGARSIKIDNPGGQWLRVLRPFERYIAPYTTGVVLSLPGAIDLAWLDTVPPAGQQNTGSGAAATVIYSDAQLADNPGTAALPSPTAGLQLTVTGVVNGPAGSVWAFNVVVPVGTWRLSVFSLTVNASAPAGNNPYYGSITLPGQASPWAYVQGNTNPPSGGVPPLAFGDAGPQFTSDGSSTSAGEIQVSVTAWIGSGAWTGNRAQLAAVLLPVAF